MPWVTETDVKTGLGVETFNNVTKDGLMRFMRALPDMDRELAKQVLAQVPVFVELARAILKDAEASFAAVIAANAQSQEKVFQVELKIIEVLGRELDRGDLAPEQQARVLDDLRKIHEAADLRHRENQGMFERLWERRLAAGLLIAGGVAVIALRAAASGDGKSGFDAFARAGAKALSSGGAMGSRRS
ncbi:MAG: hypothetical protein QOI48_3755 [Solirubrobacteraceae bacterium]|jgi:hypothetical protein|nr:hypothetical protein [Solirubrobacteraceae bacterium]